MLAPSVELATALLDAVERGQRMRGREVWPTPQVHDFGAWLKEQHVRRQLLDASTPRCLADAEERELWRGVVLDLDSSGQFLEPGGAARAARGARRAMYEHAIPLAALRAYGTEESQALTLWIGQFEARCRALNCIGPGELLGALLQPSLDAAEPSAQGVTWIESPLWRPVARRWLERRCGAPLPAETAAQACGANRVRAAHVLRAVSPAAELASIADWARRGLESDASFRAWISIRDLAARRAEVADAFDAALAPRRFSLEESAQAAPYALAGGTPLAEHGPVRAALQLLSVSSGSVPFERFSLLLRSPELQDSPEDASAAARSDTLLRASAPSEAPLGGWIARAHAVARELGPPAALERLSRAAAALGGLHGSHRMSRWLSVWVEAFERGPWSLRQRWSSAEYQSAERFRELLASLALGDQTFGSLGRRAAEGILERAARDTPFQVQTGVPPIWVSSQLTDPWLGYQGLWVTGCDENHWPPPVDPMPLIPPLLQRQYAVAAASADAQLELAEDLQRRWLERAGGCVFSCAEPGEGRSIALSPLLTALAPPPASGQPAAVPQPHWRAQHREAPLLEQLTDEQAPPVEPCERTRGVASLRAQSRCAFRGFAETRLGALVLEQPRPGFNDRERGEILHDALRRIWREVRDSTQLRALLVQPQALAALVRNSASLAVEGQCARRNPGTRWAQRERTRLQGLLERWLQLEGQRRFFQVEQVEEASELAQHAGLEFTVRVDRIDRLEDGGRVVIDYKTGSVYADWRGERPDNPQLPMYGLLHRQGLIAVAYGRVSAAQCAFVVECALDDVFPRKRATKLEGMASFGDLVAAWEQRIERLAREFARGDAAVAPTEFACRSCRLQGLCRVPSTLDALANSWDAPAA
ncbi:MAG TPA: PD-(D/E)XK nuclease family protein [Steroidobacteraceae bacterium]|nr:PD-(D/E)XK nuclease family protein [Steroidobacteraceae bacterium]